MNVRIALLSFFLGVLCLSSLAQTGAAPGIPPFSSLSGSKYDSVNLSNSNLLITLPIRSKPGILPFSSNLVGNLGGFQKINGAWYLDTYHYLHPVVRGGDIEAHTNATLQEHSCTEGQQTEDYEHFLNVVVIDSAGTIHPTTATLLQAYPCTTNGTLEISPALGTVFNTTDGSGYTLVLDSVGQFTRPTFTIYEQSGNVVQDDGLNIYESNTSTNPNGVTITSATSQTSTIFTDSFGVPVITIVPNVSTRVTSATYTDINGMTQTVGLNYTSQTLQTNFGCVNRPDGFNTQDIPATATSLLSSLSLPDGSAFTFTYETTPGFSGSVTGRLATLGLPDGGSISYQYEGVNNGLYCQTGGIPTLVRTVSDANGNSSVWTYAFSAPSTSTPIYTTTNVTDPAENITTYSFANGYVTQVESFQGASASGTPLQSVTTCYNGNFSSCVAPSTYPNPITPAYTNQPVGQTDVYTSLNGGSPSLVETTYNQASLPTEVKQYDFGAAMPPSGTPLVDTVTTYGTWNSGSCTALAGYIQDRPCLVQVKGATGILSQVEDGYDAKGNLLNDSRLVSGSTYVSTGHTYATNGALLSSTDNNGNLTSYTNTYCNNLLPASITSGGLTQSLVWDCNGGVITSSTDPNSQTTSYAFNDPFWRPKGTTYPDGGATTIEYNPHYVMTSVSVQGSQSLTTEVTLDALGRAFQTQVTSTGPTDSSFSATSYDVMGRLLSKSNPYRSNTEATYGVTSYSYDALGRKVRQCQQDNGNNSPCLPGTSYLQWSYNNNTTDFYNEIQKHWQSKSDALGRLTTEREPDVNNNPTVETDYTYDANSNLTQVDQWGGPSGTAGEVKRIFSYDGLSRLTNACNPEGFGTTVTCTTSGPWSTTYGYDGNSNVLTKTDARGASTGEIWYCYDALNRLTGKAYTQRTCPMTSPDVAYVYDTSSITGNTNTKGRLTGETTLMNGSVWTKRLPYFYDQMGRLKGEQQCTPENCSGTPYTLAYTFDLAGDITSSTNGLSNPGILLTYGRDGTGRLSSLTSTWEDAEHPTPLFAPPTASNTFQYDPAGQLLNANLAVNSMGQPAITVANTYDKRLRPLSATDAGQAGTPGIPAMATVTVSGTEKSIGGSGSTTQATGTISLSYSGGQVAKGGAHPSLVHPLFVGSSITLPGGYRASFVGSENSAVATANTLAAVLNTAASPVTAVVTSGGTASAASVVLTSKATGADQNGAIKVTLVATQVAAAPASLSGGGGTTYDTGTVTATVSGTALSTNYGQTSTAQTVAQGLASVINSASLGVTATAGANGALTVTATQAGTAGNSITVALASSTSEPGLFTGPSFTGTSATLTGGTNGSTAPGTIYSYGVPANLVYSASGNLTSYPDSVTGGWTLSYDNVNRVASATANSGPWSSLGLAWTYDPFGNREKQTLSGTPPDPVPQSQNLGTPINNHIPSYTYDAAGNVTNDLVNQYTYDSEGRVCAAYNQYSGYTQYLYDAEGRRVGKASINTLSCNPASNGFAQTASYVLGQSGEQLSELDGSGNFLRSHVYANGQLLATYTNGTTQFALNDWLGTRRVIANPDGTTAGTCMNLPFGDALSCTGNVPVDGHHFTGQLHDVESGNDYMGARYYSSYAGRFLSPDPAGLYFANPANPQSLNLYSYALNNPLSNSDPTGLYCYYGDTGGGDQNAADVQDSSQFDYQSSETECNKPDEFGNTGQWINDAATHYTAQGWVDNDNRPQEYTTATSGSIDSSPVTSTLQLALGLPVDALATLGGFVADIGIGIGNLASSAVKGPATPIFRFFSCHYCGPGGAGTPNSAIDQACQDHDNCYGDAGLRAGVNLAGGPTLSLAQATAAQGCNQALYNAARQHSGAVGASSLRWWLTGGSTQVPFGYVIAPGTQASP